MFSFDVVSNIDMSEIRNAVNMATKEVLTRFDLKGSSSELKMENEELILIADNEFKLKSVKEILEQKLVKRGVSLKGLIYAPVEKAFSGNVRQKVMLQQGIPAEKAKEMVKAIKRSGIKVQVAIQSDQLRVSGKAKDDLQAAIKLLKEEFKEINLQFTNYR
jgi:uncharacterized protein YajQ (UPF0234 family)